MPKNFCPECKNGKHRNCDNVAMTEEGDIVPCECEHEENH